MTKPNLYLFLLLLVLWAPYSRNYLLTKVIKICAYVVFWRFYSFTLLHLSFRAMGPNFSFCGWISGCTSFICWKDCSSPIYLSWQPCQRSSGHNCMGFFLDSQFYLTYLCLSLQQYQTGLICNNYWNWAILGLLKFLINFGISLSTYATYASWDSDGIVLTV